MSNKIWYLPGPFHQYQEDVKALAKEAGLRIIDASVTTSREGAAEDVPLVTIRPGPNLAQGAAGSGRDEKLHAEISGMREDLRLTSLIVESFADQALVRPEGELGAVADRLFQVFEAVNAGVQSLRNERDGEVENVKALQKQVDDLLAQAEQARLADAEAKEISDLKAKLDTANVTYRANASKESLQKQVDELAK